ncbi:hypothetical protein A3841_01775 [Pontibacter flavimaris]|uniref:Uncharacterized protein n=1 Tax=Pontibacter flavimaris TaxID=1797110 RepID=A0A1Q5PAR4_9BACT|nr:hypothetical protein A3841_01775 [Pontibacter flavimaris]
MTVPEAIEYEKGKGSIDVTPNHLIKVRESIYPNKKGFELATPVTFTRTEKQVFDLEAEYFYVPQDSLVKVILYEWSQQTNSNQNLLEEKSEKELDKMYTAFQKKFEYLRKELTKRLGEPTQIEINLNSGQPNYRDGIKWLNNNGLNAYLFMFGNNQNEYRQIRLAIYKE